MRSLRIVLSLFIVFMTFVAAAAQSAAIFPVAAKENDRLAAEEIDLAIEDVLEEIQGAEATAFTDLIGTKAKKELAKCGDPACQKKFASKANRKSDFYIFSKMKFVKSSGKTIVETYLFDGSGSSLDKQKVDFSKGASAEKIAGKLAKVWTKMLSSQKAKPAEEEEEPEEEPVKPVKTSSKDVDAAFRKCRFTPLFSQP